MKTFLSAFLICVCGNTDQYHAADVLRLRASVSITELKIAVDSCYPWSDQDRKTRLTAWGIEAAVIVIDSEEIFARGCSGNFLRVSRRGTGGTLASAHSKGALVYIFWPN